MTLLEVRPTTFYFLGLTFMLSIATVATNVLLVGHASKVIRREEEKVRHADRLLAPHRRNRTMRKKHRRLEEDGGDPDHRQQLYHHRLLNSHYGRYHSEYSSSMMNGTTFLKPTDSIYRLGATPKSWVCPYYTRLCFSLCSGKASTGVLHGAEGRLHCLQAIVSKNVWVHQLAQAKQ